MSEAKVAALKAEGNQLFCRKKYALAAAKYTEALDLDDQNAILYSNRAACYLNLEQYMDASHDSLKAIKLDSSFTKAWVRLATANTKLGVGKAAVDAWKNAIKTLPSDDDADPTVSRLREEYEARLLAAEKMNNATADDANKNAIRITDANMEMPWVRAKKLLAGWTGQRRPLSTVIILSAAIQGFSEGVKGFSHLKQVSTEEGSGWYGQLTATQSLVDGIMTDERVFHVSSDNDWFNKYKDQVNFEVHAIGADVFNQAGPEVVIEKAIEMQRTSGWDKIRPILSKVLRLWIMRAFTTNLIYKKAEAAHMIYKSVIDVLTWGRSAWHDVPYEKKGAIFKSTYLWKVQALNLQTYGNMVSNTGDENARIQMLEEMYQEAENLIKDIDSHPFSGRMDHDTVMYIAYYLYPKAAALSMQGFYHKHIASIETDQTAFRDHMHKATLKYEAAAMAYLPDDEMRPYFVGAALDCLWRSGVGPYLKTTELMHDYRVTYCAMHKIWANSPTLPVTEEQFNRMIGIERETLEKLNAGEVALNHIHYRPDGFQF